MFHQIGDRRTQTPTGFLLPLLRETQANGRRQKCRQQSARGLTPGYHHEAARTNLVPRGPRYSISAQRHHSTTTKAGVGGRTGRVGIPKAKKLGVQPEKSSTGPTCTGSDQIPEVVVQGIPEIQRASDLGSMSKSSKSWQNFSSARFACGGRTWNEVVVGVLQERRRRASPSRSPPGEAAASSPAATDHQQGAIVMISDGAPAGDVSHATRNRSRLRGKEGRGKWPTTGQTGGLQLTHNCTHPGACAGVVRPTALSVPRWTWHPPANTQRRTRLSPRGGGGESPDFPRCMTTAALFALESRLCGASRRTAARPETESSARDKNRAF